MAFDKILVQFQRVNCLQQLSPTLWAVICVRYFHYLPHKPCRQSSHLYKNCWQITYWGFCFYFMSESFRCTIMTVFASILWLLLSVQVNVFLKSFIPFQDSDNKHTSHLKKFTETYRKQNFLQWFYYLFSIFAFLEFFLVIGFMQNQRLIWLLTTDYSYYYVYLIL